MKTLMTRLTHLPLALLLAAGAGSSFASNQLADGEYRYGQISGGLFSRLHEIDHTIDLTTGALPVVMPGITRVNGQRSWSIALGRQWKGDKPQGDDEHRYWRVEAEWWGGTMNRTSFESRMLKVKLSDEVSFSGVYLTGLKRLVRGETTRMWFGAGLGYLSVSMPDANAASPTCGCLSSASGSGLSLRAKTLLERDLSENTTAYLELAFSTIPKARTGAGVVPAISTRFDTPASLHLGVRRAF